jgi:hypothetical protein
MLAWLLVVASVVAVLAGAIVLVNWRERREGEARWRESMRKLTAYCEQFARAHGLVCVSGVDQWPYGWPRLHGTLDEAQLSLAFGWQRKDIWVASMRLRATGRASGEFHVVRGDDEAASRGKRLRTGDSEFDEVFHVMAIEGVDARTVLTHKARQAMLAIPGAELAYRDGVAVLSWPCDAFIAGDGASDSDYATIEFAFDVMSELAQASRPAEAIY